MNHDISNLNKAFDSRIRLGIMSMLLVNDQVEFSELKEKLELTDGNLASHITALEKLNYIEVTKKFIGKKPNTSYKVTSEGRKAFNQHLDALENIIKIRK
jgi:DNA-binding MarR family transcriptional regulator